MSRRTRAEHDKPIFKVQKLLLGSVFNRKVVLSWQIWLLVQSPYKLIKLKIFQMSITSSKISFGTQFKAHIVANRAAHHLRLKTLEKKEEKSRSGFGPWYVLKTWKRHFASYQCGSWKFGMVYWRSSWYA